MAIRLLLLLALLTPVFEPAPDAEIETIDAVLDDFHDAAAHGDKARFLGHMTDDAVFMGTDESERWPNKASNAKLLQPTMIAKKLTRFGAG